MDRLNDYIDLDRYPIHDLDSVDGQVLVDSCHQMMRTDTLVNLPGFLRSSAVDRLQRELEPLSNNARQQDYLATAYGWMNNDGFTPDHPRGKMFDRRCGVITTDMLNSAGPSWELFRFDELTRFVQRLLSAATLYRSECPTLSIQVNTMNSEESFGWHYDTNDGVVSFTIQNPDEGGQFQYAPLIRDEDNEHYEEVAKLMDGVKLPRSPLQEPGTFALFLGRRSIHRVAPVGKTMRPRISLLYSYDENPGMVFPEQTCRRFTHPSNKPYRGALSSDT